MVAPGILNVLLHFVPFLKGVQNKASRGAKKIPGFLIGRRYYMVTDLLLLKIPEKSTLFERKSICTHRQLKQEIKKLFPNIDSEHTTWMTLKEKGYVIEFIIELTDPIDRIMVRIRGGKEGLQAIKIFCENFNCETLDYN
jgi:hypothetical protein